MHRLQARTIIPTSCMQRAPCSVQPCGWDADVSHEIKIKEYATCFIGDLNTSHGRRNTGTYALPVTTSKVVDAAMGVGQDAVELGFVQIVVESGRRIRTQSRGFGSECSRIRFRSQCARSHKGNESQWVVQVAVSSELNGLESFLPTFPSIANRSASNLTYSI